QAILDLQLRRLAALQRQAIIDRLAELERTIADLEDILANEARQRQIVSDEDLVVSITRGGYAKRTRADAYRTQKRGGKGVRGATLRGDDVVQHFIAT